MKKISKKRLAFLLLSVLFACAAVFSVYSCGKTESGDNSGSTTETQAQSGDSAVSTEPATTEETYAYPELDGGGAVFKFFNPINTWFYYTALVHDTMTGDVLDDTIYKRNLFLEEKFNIKIQEVNPASNDMYNYNPEVRKICQSGIDTYDAIFVPAAFNGTVGSMITDGFFYDLKEIPTINLDADWWNQTILKEAAIGTGSKIFYAGSGINLFTVQAASCVYFNQDMLSKLGLDLPYNLVRDGKWTYDKFQEYIKAGTQLNGAADFKWDNSGTAIYGLVGYEDSSTALLAGSGEIFVKADADGKPVIAFDSERFINALTKIQDILNISNGNYLYANNSDNIFHYEPIFKNGRALFTIGELKAANVFREMEATFGILPMPKYDENQTDYHTHLINQAPVLTIPVTNPRTEFTGAVLDAMAYLSNKDVIPVLFDVSVSQKQLRNDDSIDMLQIIKNSGSFEIGIAYGWVNTFYDKVRTSIGEGVKMDIASEIDKNKDKINQSIEKTLALFN